MNYFMCTCFESHDEIEKKYVRTKSGMTTTTWHAYIILLISAQTPQIHPLALP